MITKEEWYNRLKRYVPNWFTQNKNGKAVLLGYSAVLEQKSKEVDDHVLETYILNATGEFLLEHGNERGVERATSDTDASYRSKIRNIVNASNVPALKSLVDSFLVVGESTIIEHFATENFLDVGAYADRNMISTDRYDYNAFTVTVPHQVPPAVTFLEDDFYCDRNHIAGSNESSIELFENIVNSLNKNKAFGTIYRLIERST